ncbi:glycosyltransferase family 2 protein [Vulcanococcus limneticus]|uniref:glycosyltransferase family 2 protein n=1 Tax=Vulcanococcus limneticus TaxID=2170428 RepID=UPI00398BD5EF
MRQYRLELELFPTRQRARCPALWQALGDVVESTADQRLLEQFWQVLELLAPPPPPPGQIPLLGVPILNGADRLEQLLASLDAPVHTLALVDHSGGPGPVRQLLEQLERQGCPGVEQVRVARPFGNGGVATAWNGILRSFPEAAWALLVNHDVVMAPGVLAAVAARLDGRRPQWLSLLPPPAAYSAFAVTALAWNRLGLFEESFQPAYWEDNDYQDRLEADPLVERIGEGPWLAAMAAANPGGSATLAADPALERGNRRSFQLNRLWYLSRRRWQGDRRGAWVRQWLGAWDGDG